MTGVAIAAGLSAVSSIYQGFVGAKNEMGSASVEEYNARAAERERTGIGITGGYEEGQISRDGNRMISDSVAGFAAMGGANSAGAQSSILSQYLKLSDDLGVHSANVENAMNNKTNEAFLARRRADMHKKNATSQIIGGILGGVAGAAGTMVAGAAKYGGAGAATPRVSGYSGAVSNSGMYGAFGG